jgi:hypothetical protein
MALMLFFKVEVEIRIEEGHGGLGNGERTMHHVDFFMINLRCNKSTKGKSNKYVFFQNAICARSFFYFYSNAGQSQSGTLFDVVFERIRRVIAKICLNSSIVIQINSWKEAIHRNIDWNSSTCKFGFINPNCGDKTTGVFQYLLVQ